MYPKGIIYKSGKSNLHGDVRLHPKLAVKIAYHFARTFGAGMVSFAIVGIMFSFWPIIRAELTYRFGTKDQIQIEKLTPDSGKAKAEELGLNPYFSIYIPKIDAKANIVPNVDASDSFSYLKSLRDGVAHAKGTNFPGGGKTIYLFSHSTDSPVNIARYNAVFYLLSKLEKGDTVTIFFMDKEYKYIVENKFVASKKATQELGDDGSGEKLVLQTCDPPGTSLNRLMVIARPF